MNTPPGSPPTAGADEALARVPERSCYESAVVALAHIQEWAKWMAGIQAAAIAGLGAVVLKAGEAIPNSTATWPALGGKAWLALAAFTFLGIALLCSAWLLSAVASVSLRIGIYAGTPTAVSEKLDVYYIQCFTWRFGRLQLGTLMACQHWTWALGLVFLGIFFVAYLI